MPHKPLRIVHVANFGFKPVKVFLHGVAAKLSNGWTRAGHYVLPFSDRDISRWRTPLGLRSIGDARANALLLAYCIDVKPDVLVLGHAEVIRNETVDRIRAALPGLRVIQWNFDWLTPQNHPMGSSPEADTNRRKLKARMPVVDATFVTTAGAALEELGAAGDVVGFMPNPVDQSVERGRNFERDDLPCDLFFASGSKDPHRRHCGTWRDMDALASDITGRLPKLSIHSPGLQGKPTVFGPAYEEALLACRTGLNISRYNDLLFYSSDRIAHIAGNGLAVITDRSTGYDQLFGENEMAFYDTEDELLGWLDRFKGDDAVRRDMAQRGWSRYHELFDSAVVAKYMLDVVHGEHAPAVHGWQEPARVA